MKYTIRQIAEIVGGHFLDPSPSDDLIEHIIFDSRQIEALPKSRTSFRNTLFVALPGRQRDGHEFIEELQKAGVRNFLISKPPPTQNSNGAKRHPAPKSREPETQNYILVKKTLSALQSLAAHHRRRFDIPVIGITGSNGKTVVKEWLFQLLHEDFHIVRSPKSYNSQIGVPLSVLQMEPEHELAIFEAGISQTGEMEKLAHIIRPTIGVFTMLGEAHSEGFSNMEEKRKEKWKLFESAKVVLDGENTEKGETEIPFSDRASIQNALTCRAVMRHLGYAENTIAERLKKLAPVAMRLELKAAVNGCTLVNDSYNSDLTSLRIALDFLRQQAQNPKRTVVLSDILQSGKSPGELYAQVADLFLEKKVDRLIGIGREVAILGELLPPDFEQLFFENTSDFLTDFPRLVFQNETILLKGARDFEFEKIADRLAAQVHRTVLEVNLNALLHNLRVYQSQLGPGTKMMVMVKASGYGSGSIQVAKLLEFQQVDYLAVAYTDEGVALRQTGIQLPIMVLNPEEATFDALLRFRLEPEIYSLDLWEKFVAFINRAGVGDRKGRPYKVHLKLDTGMHRLGFEEKNVDDLIAQITDQSLVNSHQSSVIIKSIFTHLAASENPAYDDFTKKQIGLFEKIYARLAGALGYRPLRHVLNSSGIVRFPEHQMEMVRLGIGLYGIDGSGFLQKKLQTVNSLRASISQIKKVKAGESVGYGRAGLAERDMAIATLSIGYADGLLRRAGNGRFSVLIRGQRAALFGNVCMDMAMADVTHIPDARPGDEALIFGESRTGETLPVEELADCLETIPYEVFTSVSGRVKRVYVQE